ncbi:hypothetical protein NQD34_015304 [Periophthalmus magnuspinnatus]|nr:hypothetical protein NQD34_015304 [Periophthalmus magnuspinnatus]
MLRSMRSMPPSFGFLSYSDQPPGAEANTKLFGHSKGVVMGDSFTQTALWITHSTPQFPFRRDQNRFWPDSGNVNGQSFMCVSLPFSELKGLGEHLQNIQAYPYDYDLPDTFPDELKDAARWVTSSTSQSKLRVMHTRGNQELNLMAKPLGHNASDGDLYMKLANAFNSDMSVQTWGCQRGGDKSFCPTGQWKVMNVEEIGTALTTWTTRQDHSKWGVTTRQNIAWTCFGDVNRSESQYQRWGGALCIKDAQVNAAFKRFIRKTLLCHKRPLTCPDSDLSDATRTASFG